MQKFNKKQIALAVSATLLAGSAMAAALTPLTGATKTVLATAVGGGATADDLYTNAGVTGAVNIAFLANAAVTFGAATTFNTGTDANDDVTVKAGGTNIPAAQLALNNNVVGIGGGNNIVVTITPVAPAAVRINNATGALEYTADKSAATPTWGAVTLQVNVVAGNAVTDNAVAIDAATAATTAFASSDFILPTTAKTFAAAGASLLTGVTVDFKHPVAAPTKTTLQLWSKAVAPLANAEDITNSAKTGITVPTFTAVTGSTTAYVVALPDATKVDWDNSGTIDGKDADLVKYDSFNTGLAGGSAPVELKVPATGPAYTNIFKKTTGQADTVATTTLNAADGAAPVLTGAEYQSAGTLTLTFSEPVRTITNASANVDDVREILENVKLNGVTLAADYQIREAQAWLDVTGTRTLVINNFGEDRTDVEGKSISLTSGLSLVEDAATPTADTEGLRTLTGTGAAALDNTFSGSFVATLNNTVAFDDSSARAFYAQNDLTKIDYIDVDFNKTLSVKAGKSLDKTLKVTFKTVNALTWGNGNDGYSFDWYPTGSEIDYTTVPDTIRLKLPTDLLRANLQDNFFIGLSTVTYTAGTDKPLEAAINATTKVDVADADVDVIMPLMATAANQGLYTMDVKATLTGAQAGSKVVGYLAKWVDKATADVVSMDIVSGKVTLPGDKWASDVVLALDGGVGALETEINEQLKETKPAAVTGWVVVSRSNDAVKGGSNAGTDGYQDSTENFLVATAKLYGTAAAAAAAASNGQAEKTAFEVTIDPKTGKISGRLTGQLVLKNQNTNANERGLVFIKPDGKLSNSAGAAAQSQALVDGTGKARFLIGADPKADLKGAGDIFKDAFVLVVHESQDADGNSSYALVTSAEPSMSNFLPFSANIVAGNDAVGSLNLTLANNVKRLHPGTMSWQLFGAGNLDRKTGATAAINMPRLLVGLSGAQPYSFWTNDGAAIDGSDYKDMALTMLGNKAGVAVEAKDKDTVTVADKANTKANAFAFAFADDNITSGHLFFATKAAEAPALPVGWSLIAQPAAAATSALTDATMVLTGNADYNVGIGGSWVTGDAAKDLSAGQPIFIYQKKAVAGK